MPITHKHCPHRDHLGTRMTPVEDFYRNPARKPGTSGSWQPYCKTCSHRAAADWKRNRPKEAGVKDDYRIMPIGEKSAVSKLTNAAVKEIRQRLSAGHTCYRIAQDFAVSRSCISSVKNGYSWTHI